MNPAHDAPAEGTAGIIPPEAAPELDPYRDEPAQLATGSPGKVGMVHLRFEQRGDKSILAHLERRAPLIVQRAIHWDEAMPGLPCVYLISNAGGILQGDRYHIDIRLEPGAMAHVASQSSTKIQEMDANHASQVQEIRLEAGSYLEYMPEPVIPHRHSRFLTNTRVMAHPTACMLYSEILVAGRKHYGTGELFEYDLFSSTLRAERPGGDELFTERFVIQPALVPPRQSAVMGGFHVFGNVIVLADREKSAALLERCPPEFRPAEGCASGASLLPNDAGLVFKVLGMEAQPVRARVRAFWEIARPILAGHTVPPEFPWR